MWPSGTKDIDGESPGTVERFDYVLRGVRPPLAVSMPTENSSEGSFRDSQ